METGYIKFTDIETDNPSIDLRMVNGTVWMTVNEIADLFGVYTPLINKNLKTIFKDNLSRENEVMKEYRYTKNENEEYICIYYNLEIIILLIFRIQSPKAKALREWALNILRGNDKERKQQNIIVVFNSNKIKFPLKTLN